MATLYQVADEIARRLQRIFCAMSRSTSFVRRRPKVLKRSALALLSLFLPILPWRNLRWDPGQPPNRMDRT